jgi:predicted PhzF superfamily epimerase YddE/YHI9
MKNNDDIMVKNLYIVNALLCYLKRQGALPEQDTFRIEQGEAMGRLSYIYGLFKEGIVWIGGKAEVMNRK